MVLSLNSGSPEWIQFAALTNSVIANECNRVMLAIKDRPMARAAKSGEDDKAGLEEAGPHYHGHRERLRGRFREAGPDSVADYELLELVLFRAIPQRDVKPLAKALIETFGSFAETVSAPETRLREIKGLGEAAITEIKIVQAAASRLAQGTGEGAQGTGVMVVGARLLPHRDGIRRKGAIPYPVPGQAQPADRRRGPADRHRGPHAGLSA